MQEHFSSVPGTYYSDSLFYLSLGLYKIAPSHHNKVILLDVDVKFQNSIEHLYEYFQKWVVIFTPISNYFKRKSTIVHFRFGPKALFGLAPELSPVYHHILWKWKQANDNSSFGEPHTAGFPGVNSGVVLVQLNRIRHSESYSKYISEAYVTEITKKYLFKVSFSLGDVLLEVLYTKFRCIPGSFRRSRLLHVTSHWAPLPRSSLAMQLEQAALRLVEASRLCRCIWSICTLRRSCLPIPRELQYSYTSELSVFHYS